MKTELGLISFVTVEQIHLFAAGVKKKAIHLKECAREIGNQ